MRLSASPLRLFTIFSTSDTSAILPSHASQVSPACADTSSVIADIVWIFSTISALAVSRLLTISLSSFVLSSTSSAPVEILPKLSVTILVFSALTLLLSVTTSIADLTELNSVLIFLISSVILTIASLVWLASPEISVATTENPRPPLLPLLLQYLH